MSINYREFLDTKYPDKVMWTEGKTNEIYLNNRDLLEVLKGLKTRGFTFLSDISAADYKEYFEVVYQLFSHTGPDHLVVKLKVDRNKPQVYSVAGIWITADWLEREVYDLMGITFTNHPNLERILTFEGFEGHPLRKDYVSKSGRKQMGS